jgi:putative hydrolase of the HAD superfamily
MIRAVSVDAAGTLFAPAEPVGETYARVARRHGIAASPATVERAFRAAFSAAPPLAFPGASPAARATHERAWWYTIVRASLQVPRADAAFDACAEALFAHYARAEAWHVFADVPAALAALRARGLRLVVVSNFDARLGPLLDALGLASWFDHVEHSVGAGAAKPDPRIFLAALGAIDVAPTDAVHVGDAVVDDVEGARAAGLGAVLLDRSQRRPAVPAGVDVIGSLAEVPALLAAHA